MDESFLIGVRSLHAADIESYDSPNMIVSSLAHANVVSSIQIGQSPHSPDATHFPVIDIDIPARLIPSSTPGHSHLYIDHPVPESMYWPLLHALADAGIVEQGYVDASEARGYTSVRLPWVRKGNPAPASSNMWNRHTGYPVGRCTECIYGGIHRHGSECDHNCACEGIGAETEPLTDGDLAECDWGHCSRESVAVRLAGDIWLAVCAWHAGWLDYPDDTYEAS